MKLFFKPYELIFFKAFLFTILISFLTLPGSITIKAQQKTLLQRVQAATENHSSTGKITVYYSPQYEKKALKLRSMLEDMMSYFNDKLKVKMHFTLAVLDETQWNRVVGTMQRRDIFMLEMDKPSGLEPFSVPYGIPLSSTPPNIVFIPATANNQPTKNVLSVKSTAPEFVLKAIKANKLTYEEAAEKMPDLIGFHEIGHNYVDEYGIHATNPWLREFLAHYFAYAFLSKKYPNTARLFSALHEALIAGIKPKHTSLADLNNLSTRVGAENYGWYQAQFLRMVARVYKKKGFSFITEMKNAFPAGEKDSVNMEAGLKRLEKIYPGFIEWAKDLR
jgi:hypothetical protein